VVATAPFQSFAEGSRAGSLNNMRMMRRVPSFLYCHQSQITLLGSSRLQILASFGSGN